jgi:hypothetical protein
MKSFTIFKNGIQMNTVTAKDLTFAIRLAGIFTENGLLTCDPSTNQQSFREVRHDDIYVIFETEMMFDVLVSDDIDEETSIVLSFETKKDATIAHEHINKSLHGSATLLF